MTQHPNTTKTLKITTWVFQILLTITLLWAAFMKLFQSTEQLAHMWPWTADNPILTKITGVFDTLGALGIILPTALHIRTSLVIFSSYGIIALMVSAIIFHILRGEASQIGFNIFVIIIAGFIVWAKNKQV